MLLRTFYLENAQAIEDSMIESRGLNKMFNGKSLTKIVFWIEVCICVYSRVQNKIWRRFAFLRLQVFHST